MGAQDILFVLAAAAAAISAAFTVTRRNAIHSATWMLRSLLALSVIFLLLQATFLFVVQVLLYAGAILVLFVFVIMLLNPGPADAELDRPPALSRALALAMSLALAAVVIGALRESGLSAGTSAAFTGPGAPEPPAGFGTTAAMGTLYDRWLVPFEMLSILITAAIAAVIVLAKRTLAPSAEGGGIGEKKRHGHGHDQGAGQKELEFANAGKGGH